MQVMLRFQQYIVLEVADNPSWDITSLFGNMINAEVPV